MGKGYFLAIVLVSVSFWIQASAADSLNESYSLAASNQELMRQGVNQCGATSLFNALLLGRPEMNAAVQNLPGNTLTEKFQYYLSALGGKPSEYFHNGRARLSVDIGMAVEDIRNLALDVFHDPDDFEIDHVRSKSNESNLQFAERIHGEILRSLRAGMPPVVAFNEFQNNSEVSLGHALTITGVSAADANGAFAIHLVDPNREINELDVQVVVFDERRIGYTFQVETADHTIVRRSFAIDALLGALEAPSTTVEAQVGSP